MKPRVVVIVEGGIVTSIISDTEGLEVRVLDYDTEGADEEDLITDLWNNRAYLYGGSEMTYDPSRVEKTFKL